CLNLAEQLAKEELYLELPGLFHGIRLKSPVVGAVVDGSMVSFHWSGGADSYSLCCSTDKSFTDCAPVELLSLQAGNSHLLGFSSVTILALIAGLICRVKKRSLIALFCGLIFLGSCGGCAKIFISPTYPPAVNVSTWVKDLEPGTKYYWKVIAHGNTGIDSESVVRTFTTME
ncbi:MAG: fibronectin type III domain-containing protein, partial [Bacteroidales bacterium]|nr:fibronectin type III domain-containing protein [Bacteroidales bacterium]